MKRIKPKINLEQLQLLSEADEEALCGGRTTTGRDIIIHTSSGDDIVSGASTSGGPYSTGYVQISGDG